MLIISLNYVAPLDQLDAHMAEHMTFLRRYYKENVFVVSGRKVPRTGGVILALGKSKEEIEAIMNQDPFCKLKLAEFTVTEFQASQVHPELKEFFNARAGGAGK
jgi:uncharacterized protein YciI